MERIVVRNIVRSYGKKKVLKGVSLSAAAGECIGIVGENGCGKSTLFNILAGLKKADSGELFFDTGKSPAACVGYVPQEGSLMNELSVLDNLSLWYRDRAELRLSLKQGFLKELGVDEMCRTRVDKFSGGMKKRLSIGCAVVAKPRILLLDEPSAALDLVCKENIYRYLERYKAEGGIVLLATHDMQELELCERCYIIKEGVLEAYQYDGDLHHLAGKLR